MYNLKFGASHWPALVINNITYRGDIEAEAVFFAICSGFDHAPKECQKHDITADIENSNNFHLTWK
jgi:hypothetical protein